MKKCSITFDERFDAYRIDYYHDGYRSFDYTSWKLIAYLKKIWFLCCA